LSLKRSDKHAAHAGGQQSASIATRNCLGRRPEGQGEGQLAHHSQTWCRKRCWCRTAQYRHLRRSTSRPRFHLLYCRRQCKACKGRRPCSSWRHTLRVAHVACEWLSACNGLAGILPAAGSCSTAVCDSAVLPGHCQQLYPAAFGIHWFKRESQGVGGEGLLTSAGAAFVLGIALCALCKAAGKGVR
jgi:hypothetical protein